MCGFICLCVCLCGGGGGANGFIQYLLQFARKHTHAHTHTYRCCHKPNFILANQNSEWSGKRKTDWKKCTHSFFFTTERPQNDSKHCMCSSHVCKIDSHECICKKHFFLSKFHHLIYTHKLHHSALHLIFSLYLAHLM